MNRLALILPILLLSTAARAESPAKTAAPVPLTLEDFMSRKPAADPWMTDCSIVFAVGGRIRCAKPLHGPVTFMIAEPAWPNWADGRSNYRSEMGSLPVDTDTGMTEADEIPTLVNERLPCQRVPKKKPTDDLTFHFSGDPLPPQPFYCEAI